MSDGMRSTPQQRLVTRLIERGDRRSLALLEMMRPLPLSVRIRNATYHWSKP